MNIRKLQRVIPSVPTSDGAGVSLRRSIGSQRGLYLDPFLMLDEFSSENPDDYVAGFPSHPHRGFETVTYMLDGHMQHRDHLGNVGELRSGGVQWMTAGRGVIHSEMPQQESGRMRGFQLWINLPAKEKLRPAAYRDIQAAEIPIVSLPGGGRLKVIAGRAEFGGQLTAGPVNPLPGTLATDPLYFDIELPASGEFTHALAAGHTAFVYPYEGSLVVGGDTGRELASQQLGVLGEGDQVELRAGAAGTRFILLAGRPLKEPIVQYGPFVMNTRDEIERAIQDYQGGTLTASS